jgi:hypothetical protein
MSDGDSGFVRICQVNVKAVVSHMIDHDADMIYQTQPRHPQLSRSTMFTLQNEKA